MLRLIPRGLVLVTVAFAIATLARLLFEPVELEERNGGGAA